MPMKTAASTVDMLSELQTTFRKEQASMKPAELIYMAALLRALRYVLGLEDTLSDSWRQARIPVPPAMWKVGDRVTRNEHGPVMRGRITDIEITTDDQNLYVVLWDDAISEMAYPGPGLDAEGTD